MARARSVPVRGATFFVVMADYAHRLEQVDGRHYLSGVDPAMLERMTRSRSLEAAGPVRVYQVTDNVGESTVDAYHDADVWLIRRAREQERPRGVIPPG
jgi:SulP family sulfate permease